MASRLRVSVPDPGWAASLAGIPGVDALVWDVGDPQPEGHIDLVVLPYGAVREPLRRLDPTRIGLVQSQALGYDGVAEVLPAGVAYANAVGVHEANTAELALALTLSCQRRLDEFARQQVEGDWQRPWSTGLVGTCVAVVGVGGIGGEVVRRLAGFDCEVLRFGRTRRDDEQGTVHGVAELPEMASGLDVVILALPLTVKSQGLVDAGLLRRLPDQALVVNVSRAQIVDTQALLSEGGRIRYATDVVEPEPLPADHPLRSAPGVFLTPHVGGRVRTQRDRVGQVVREQIARLLAGERPANVVIGG